MTLTTLQSALRHPLTPTSDSATDRRSSSSSSTGDHAPIGESEGPRHRVAAAGIVAVLSILSRGDLGTGRHRKAPAACLATTMPRSVCAEDRLVADIKRPADVIGQFRIDSGREALSATQLGGKRLTTCYSEAAYFDGDHCAHVATWREVRRRQRIMSEARRAVRRNAAEIAKPVAYPKFL